MWRGGKRPGSGSIRPLPAQAAAGFLFPGRRGVFSVPLEKTEMFLTAPQGRASAALSGLSDDAAGLKTFSRAAASRAAAEEFWPRWQMPGIGERLETPRF